MAPPFINTILVPAPVRPTGVGTSLFFTFGDLEKRDNIEKVVAGNRIKTPSTWSLVLSVASLEKRVNPTERALVKLHRSVQ